MMTNENIVIRIISTLAILIPVACNARILRTAGPTFRLFFAFLIIGFCNDLIGWYNYYINHILHLENVTLEGICLMASIAYSLIEATFFFWLVFEHPRLKKKKIVRAIIFAMIGAGGTYLFFWRDLAVSGDVSHSSLFDAAYQIIVSSAAGVILLDYAENEPDMVRLPLFWIFTGIFFYCFSTFFIFVMKLIVANDITDQIWFVHNIVNMFTYFFFCLGFGRYPAMR